MPWLEIKIMEIKDIAATVSNKCVANQVRQLNRSLSRIYDEQLRPHGMKISQFTILVAIANLGEVTPQTISSTLSLEKSTLSRSLERLVQKGWLVANYSHKNRIQTVTVTEAGKRQIVEASQSWSKAQKQVQQLIEQNQLATLFAINRSLNNANPN